jgi:hypothetical protein
MNTETRIRKALISNILYYAGETWIMYKVEMTLAATEQKIFNPWITEQKKLHTFIELGTYCTHIFKIIFSTFFFQSSINRLN